MSGPSSSVGGSAAAAAPSFLRVESVQCVAQSIPAITASIPQVHTAPHKNTPLLLHTTLPQLDPHTTLSPLNPITYTSASCLAQAAESRLKEIIRTATAFMRHANRRVLSTDDINLALRHKNAPPLYGFDGASLGVSSAIGGGVSAELSFASASEDLFVLTDPLVNFEDFLAQPLPSAPTDTTFSMHWLAIDGVQPLIPENPGLDESAIVGAPTAGGESARDLPPASTSVTLDKSDKEVVTKTPIKHVLSKEQSLYYEYVTSALRGTDSTLKKAVYKSLSQDDGLYQLLPYFTQFIAEEVSRNLHNLPLLTALMRMANCILHSPYLHVDPYLHQLMPPILTCIVGKQLCLEPFEDHWSLREYASDLLLLVCQRYAHTYPTLQPRVSKTLVVAWMDPNRSLNTHYGCIVSLRKLGPLVVKKLIVPYVKKYFELLSSALQAKNDATRMEASFVYHALLAAVGEYIRFEIDKSASPSEMAAAVLAATNAATASTAAAATNAAAADANAMEDVVVKQEAGTGVESTNKKRRRVAASSPAAAAAPTLSSSVLPDRDALDGIEMLLELFGEALQPPITAALKSLAEREAAKNAPVVAPDQPAATNRSGKIVINKINLNAATAFL